MRGVSTGYERATLAVSWLRFRRFLRPECRRGVVLRSQVRDIKLKHNYAEVRCDVQLSIVYRTADLLVSVSLDNVL